MLLLVPDSSRHYLGGLEIKSRIYNAPAVFNTGAGTPDELDAHCVAGDMMLCGLLGRTATCFGRRASGTSSGGTLGRRLVHLTAPALPLQLAAAAQEGRPL